MHNFNPFLVKIYTDKQLLAKRADPAVARRSRRRGWPPVGVSRGCPLGVFCELNVDNFRPFFGGSKFTEMYDFLWSQGDSPFHKIMYLSNHKCTISIPFWSKFIRIRFWGLQVLNSTCFVFLF